MFYEKFVSLCAEKGMSKQSVCAACGLSSPPSRTIRKEIQ